MSRPLRIGSAVSAAALASMLAACAASQTATNFGGKVDPNVGLATRAMAALNSNDLTNAIDLAERAVEKSPNDAGYRALLGNVYFASGRFASAQAAYKDSLTLYSNQPKVILKLALVETALGKKDEAVAFLQAGRSVLEPSDLGLALALAGRASDAVELLDAAAREPGADATVRQNLALAHALAGDWAQARTVAAQDIPADQVDTRIHQWMQLASPKKPSDQVAALIGVTPASTDGGQPVRLALRKADTMLAQAAPAPVIAPQPAKVTEPQPAYVVAPPPPIARRFEEAVAPAPKPQVAQAPVPAAPTVASMLKAARDAAASYIPFLAKKPPVHVARAVRVHPAPAFKPDGPVVQLGAYSSPDVANAAWGKLTRRHPALRAYLPLRARFSSPKGTFWRLSIQGFANQQQAASRCRMLKSNGGSCFVRAFAGDAPVRMASL